MYMVEQQTLPRRYSDIFIHTSARAIFWGIHNCELIFFFVGGVGFGRLNTFLGMKILWIFGRGVICLGKYSEVF